MTSKQEAITTITASILVTIFMAYVGTVLVLTTRHPAKQPIVAAPEMPALTHKQETWMAALEWCESSGNPTAINPKDRDGTPSYGMFEFKPDTFTAYIQKFGIPAFVNKSNVIGAMLDGDVQSALMTQMILHAEEIDWHQQFPDCVKRLGTPPAATLSVSARY